MKRTERNKIIRWAKRLTDKELEDACYDLYMDCSESIVWKMRELDYDIRDIEERAAYENFMCQKFDLVCRLCEERGIKLWA